MWPQPFRKPRWIAGTLLTRIERQRQDVRMTGQRGQRISHGLDARHTAGEQAEQGALAAEIRLVGRLRFRYHKPVLIGPPILVTGAKTPGDQVGRAPKLLLSIGAIRRFQHTSRRFPVPRECLARECVRHVEAVSCAVHDLRVSPIEAAEPADQRRPSNFNRRRSRQLER